RRRTVSSCVAARPIPRSAFLFYSSGAHRDLHSFPTRRSSDLFSIQKEKRARSRGDALRHLPREADSPSVSTLRSNLGFGYAASRSEEHTSELQSRENLVCRLLLEKKTRRTACDRLIVVHRSAW